MRSQKGYGSVRNRLWVMGLPASAAGLATLCLGLVFASRLPAAQSAPAAGESNDLNEPLRDPGVRPVNEDGQPLNLNFESGTLADWRAVGEAFQGQPVQGEIAEIRDDPAGKRSEHTGEYWIGGYERLGDAPTGSLESAPFEVTHRFASFLVGGGAHPETRVELIDADTRRVILSVSGRNQENLVPVIVDLQSHVGLPIAVRLVDDHRGGWGHINFDDFRFHAERPVFREPQRIMTPAPPRDELYPYHDLTAERAVEVMELPEGFRAQVGAAEPEVRQPIAMALDDRGRVWIAEAYTYPTRAPEGEGRDRILIFEDTDGNGSLDSRKVFFEGLNLVSGLEVGFGGVWVGAAPYLLFLPDRDRDDKPDGPPEVLLDGWGYEDTHETLNAFIWGPDGWLYGCHGVFTHSRVGAPGTPDEERVRLNAGIWRFHPTRHTFEVFAEGTSNPWGLDFNDYGDAFCTACVIPHLYHVVQGGRYQRQAGTHFNPHTYDDIKTIAVHRHFVGNQWNDQDRLRSNDVGGGHAHAGAMFYLGGKWPDVDRNQLFMHNIHGNRVNVDLLQPRGSGYVGDQAPDFLLTRDLWSQMLHFRYGPDGQVWVIDWYDQNQCHRREPDAHDRGNGRIYRIVYGDPDPVRVNLAEEDDMTLAGYVTSENDWFVRHARRLLQERSQERELQPQAREYLAGLAQRPGDPRRRLRAMWALHVTGNLDRELALRLLDEADPHVRGWTVQLMCERGLANASDGERLVQLARTDDSQVTRRFLASAAQRVPLSLRWDLLEALMSHPQDATDHNLPLLYWYALEPLADVDPRRALAVAMLAGAHHPQIQEFMVRRLASGDQRRALTLLIDGLLDTSDAERRRSLLRGMNRAMQDFRDVEVPPAWGAAYAELRESPDDSIRLLTHLLARQFGDTRATAHLLDTILNEREPVADRRAALRGLVQARDPAWLRHWETLATSNELSSEAIRGLAAFDRPDTARWLVEQYANLPGESRRDAIVTLCTRTSFAEVLLDGVGEGKIPPRDITADQVRQIENLGSEQLLEHLESVWGTVRQTDAERMERIAEYRSWIESPEPGSDPADVAWGRTLFEQHCANCHTLFGSGGNVGPDLTGSNRGQLDYVLSNVVDPSAVLAREYRPMVLQLDDGRVITGIVRGRNENALTVQTTNETLVLPRSSIEFSRRSDKSMMPDDLLTPLSPGAIRSLIAYLAQPAQTPRRATPDNVGNFDGGPQLEGWTGNRELWSWEDGEIVGRSPGLNRNEFLVKDLDVGDFRLEFDVLLHDNRGNSGVQFRSRRLDNGMAGYQADIGPGWWGKLYDEHGRGLLWSESAQDHVRFGEWNHYVIVAEGHHIRTWLNGEPCVDMQDPDGARRGLFGLQLHSGGPMHVRFKNFQLELLESDPATAGIEQRP